MCEVIHFPFRPRIAQAVTADRGEINAVVRSVLLEGACRICGGSGLKVRPKNLRLTQLEDWDIRPCPCGGDDENRIHTDEPDFPGAA